ncbi:S41 family peptidase [candidate division KSB1 bacterium]|nr:S41 family peptidase [candidate division KSB1 bacterium]RQW00176.1 MAG: S41 family peptidase [candidate division KSB1 bacterium]
MRKHCFGNKNKPQLYFLVLLLIFCALVIGIKPRFVWSNVQQLYNKWMILTMILEKIERFYVDEKHPDDLLKDAIDGMLFGLDPHSVYLTAEQYKDYSKKYDGYYGLGLKYCRFDSVLVVSSIIENSPAATAGIRIGDRIVKISGINIAAIRNESLEQFLSGQEEKIITMLVERPNEEGRFSLELVKRQILDDTIPIDFMIRDDIGYIRLLYFADSTPRELDKALSSLMNAGMKKLILDLRDNSGGALNSGVAVADRFIPAGKLIGFTKGRAPQSSEQFVANHQIFDHIPLIVLVNETTASDAEIVAGAIQDWDRGLIIGRKTYGKALVQTEYTFQDESVLLLTTARYYTPLGRLIQKDYQENETDLKTDKKDEPQKYKTAKGRIVYGGGGIQPDITLQNIDQVFPECLRALYSLNENIFFKFADKYVISQDEQFFSYDMQTFRSFKVDALLWQQFKEYVQRSKIKITSSELESNAKILQNKIKVELAGRLWGDKGRYAVTMANDPEVNASLVYFNQASALLKK